MRFQPIPVCALMVAGFLGTVEPTEARCPPDGDIRFVCGPVSTEDLAAAPETPWVIASGMEGKGHLCTIDARTSRVETIDPVQLSVQEIVRYPSNNLFILGTVALPVGDELWLGGIGGADRIIRFPRPR